MTRKLSQDKLIICMYHVCICRGRRRMKKQHGGFLNKTNEQTGCVNTDTVSQPFLMEYFEETNTLFFWGNKLVKVIKYSLKVTELTYLSKQRFISSALINLISSLALCPNFSLRIFFFSLRDSYFFIYRFV